MLTRILTAFESHAHPYKENIVKFDGRTVVSDLPSLPKAPKTKMGSIAEMPAVQQTLAAAQEQK